MQRGGGTSACASCKHQRKKCAVDKCVLAPFFPADKAREFQAVHKVFGVSNVTKIVTNLKEEDRKRAVESLIWEALCRVKDPVLGPYGEYKRVCEELRLYRNQYQQYHQIPSSTTQQGGNMVMYNYKGGGGVGAQGLMMGWGNTRVTNSIGGLNISYNNNNNNNNNNSDNNLQSKVKITNNLSVENIGGAGRGGALVTHQSDNNPVLVMHHRNPPNGLNNRYFLPQPERYNAMDSRSVESTIWEDSS